jgi:AraC-like DNA-binding protein
MVDVEFLWITRALTAALAVSCIWLIFSRAPRNALSVHFALFAGSMFCAALYNTYGDSLGPAAGVAKLGGFAGCGWAWLFARALFQPKPVYEIWPLALVGAIIAPEAAAQLLTIAGGDPAGFTGPGWRIAENMQSLASSTVLVLAFVEAVRGYSSALPARERRFRQIFMAGYASMIAVAVLWVTQPAEGSLAAQMKDAVQATCAFCAMALAALAARFRIAFPLAEPAPTVRPKKRVAPSDPEMAALARKVDALVKQPDIFTTANLKVGDIAAMLSAPDYKVSRCVAGAMGFSNFNRLVNHYRIEHAKEMLVDPAFDDQSILAVGLDCGFGSVGPFNRAFKEATGQTPRDFRAHRAHHASRSKISQSRENAAPAGAINA